MASAMRRFCSFARACALSAGRLSYRLAISVPADHAVVDVLIPSERTDRFRHDLHEFVRHDADANLAPQVRPDVARDSERMSADTNDVLLEPSIREERGRANRRTSQTEQAAHHVSAVRGLSVVSVNCCLTLCLCSLEYRRGSHGRSSLERWCLREGVGDLRTRLERRDIVERGLPLHEHFGDLLVAKVCVRSIGALYFCARLILC